MRTISRLLAAGIVVGLLGLPIAARAVDADITGVQKGLSDFAGWTSGLAGAGLLGEVLPVVPLVPGSAGALGLDTLFGKAVAERLAAASPQTYVDLDSIATDGVDLEDGGRHVAVSVTRSPNPAPDLRAFAIGIVATRTVDAQLSLHSDAPQFTLASAAGVRAQLTGRMSFGFTYDTTQDLFAVTDPALAVDVTASIPDVSKVANAAVGILGVRVTSSTLAYAAHLAASFSDPNGDGHLAFKEASGSGELASPSNAAQLVTADYASSPASAVSGAVGVGTAPGAIPGLSLPAVSASVQVDDANLSDETPAALSISNFDSRLAPFTYVRALDLANGIAMLASAVDAAQRARPGDVDLPFLKGTAADLIPATETLRAFLAANIGPNGVPTFTSLQGFFEKLVKTGTAPLSVGVSETAFDEATAKLSFRLRAERTTSSLSGAQLSPLGLRAGDALRPVAGLSGVNAITSPASGSTVQSSYVLDVPMVVDLQAPKTGDACKQAPVDPVNTAAAACPFVLSTPPISTIVPELPRPSDRFLVRTGGTLAFGRASADLVATGVAGSAGFVRVDLTNVRVKVEPSSADPLARVTLKPQGVVRIGDLIDKLRTSPGATIATEVKAKGSGSMTAAVPGASGFFSGADASITFTQTDVADPSTLVVSAPGAGPSLKPLDFATDRSALRGKVANSLGALSEALRTIGPLSAKDALNSPIQVIGRPFSGFVASPELDAALADISSKPPDDLQGLIAALAARIGPGTSFRVTPAGLVLDVVYDRAIDVRSPLGLRYGTSTLTGVGAGGTVPVTGKTEARIALVVALGATNPTAVAEVGVLPASTVDVKPAVSATGLSLSALAAALSVSITGASISAAPTLRVTNASDPSTPLSLKSWASGATTTLGGDAKTCAGGETPRAVCATLPAGDLGTFDVHLKAADALASGDNAEVEAPAGIGAAQSGANLPLAQMAGGVAPFLNSLISGLELTGNGGKLPLVGNDMQQGQAFLQKLRDDLNAKLGALPPANADSSVQEVDDALKAATTDVTKGLKVGLACGTTVCDPSGRASTITGVRLGYDLGSGDVNGTTGCGADCASASRPFSMGIPALRVTSTSSPAADLGWALKLTFVFDRERGFYIDTSENPEMRIGLRMTVKSFDATLAFLNVKVTDNDTGTPEFAGAFSVDVRAPGDTLGLQSLQNGIDLASTFFPSLDAKVRIDWTISSVSPIPGVSAKFFVTWNWASNRPSDNSSLAIGFADVTLDLKALFGSAIDPIFETMRTVLAPFKPLSDAIQAPLPGLSEMSRLAGGGDISLLKLMELYSLGPNPDLQAYVRAAKLLIGLQKAAATGKVTLGGFGVDRDKALAGVPTPDQVAALIQGALGNAVEKIKQECAECGEFIEKLVSNAAGAVGGFRLPIVEKPETLAGLLLGQDVPLAEYDTGPFNVPFNLSARFGIIIINVVVGVKGSLDFRFRAGFDTYGFRKAFESGKPTDVIDGLYVDDLDAKGVDIPEVSLTGRGGVDVTSGIPGAEVGIGGGINLDVFLDLLDPEKDGKVRFTELGRDPATGRFDPFCIFEVRGDISASLDLFVEIDIDPLPTVKWRRSLARGDILDFVHTCAAQKVPPKLGVVVGTDLVVNAGNNGSESRRGTGWGNEAGGSLTKDPRFTPPAGQTRPDEGVTVRSLHTDAGAFRGFSVDMLGHHTEFLDTNLARVVVDARGYDGHETVSLLGDAPGRRFDKLALVDGGRLSDVILVDGTAAAVVDGGPGDDSITTGDGADLITAAGGDDTVAAGGGPDQVYGDSFRLGSAPIASPPSAEGSDTLDGGLGADVVRGEGGNDTITAGQDDGRAAVDPNPAFRDENNVIIGGPGADNILGGPGKDTIYGDELVALGADDSGQVSGGADIIEAGTGDDTVYAGNGSDKVLGFSPPLPYRPLGADTVFGNGGDDDIQGGDGADTAYGGPGNDKVRGGIGSDALYGGAGDDRIGGGRLLPFYQSDISAVLLPVLVLPFEAELARRVNFVRTPRPAGPADSKDTIAGGPGIDLARGEAGDDLMSGDSAQAVCAAPAAGTARSSPPAEPPVSTDGEDDLRGEAGNDTISGEGGSDVLSGSEGADLICGHAGPDLVFGSAGADRIFGGSGDDFLRSDAEADNVFGNDGADLVFAGFGDDVAEGNAGADAVHGEFGRDHLEGNAGSDIVTGGAGEDDIFGGTSPDAVAGGSTASSPDGGDTLLSGGDAHDAIVGDNGAINAAGRTDPNDGSIERTVLLLDQDTVGGGDVIRGDGGNDEAYGERGDDDIGGGSGDDHLEGNDGADAVSGGTGQDDILGGTSPRALGGAPTSTVPDAGERDLAGDDGADVILGDNGSITRDEVWARTSVDPEEPGAVVRHIRLLDVFSGGPVIGGGDTIHGGAGHDRAFGETGDDTIFGDGGNDEIEGNNASDALHGGGGQDDAAGGTTPAALEPGTPTSAVADTGDSMVAGDTGADVLAGDDASIVHPLSSGRWATSRADGSYLRKVVLLARETNGGGDVMSGGDGTDRIWGELGPDAMDGGADTDTMEGNVGADTMSGGTGSDDMLGGTSPVALPETDPVAAATSSPDEGDAMYGHAPSASTALADDDVMLGDNGIIARCAAGGRDDCTWSVEDLGPDRFGGHFGTPFVRYVTLLGESLAPTSHDGNDVMQGNADDDLMWGINGDDTMNGNGAQDRMWGGYGADLMSGDAGDDGMLGDRGELTIVPLAGRPAQRVITSSGPPNIAETAYVPRTLWYKVLLLDPAGGGDDAMFGGQQDDSMHGGAGADFMQGDDGLHRVGDGPATGGTDKMFGDDGQDSMEGGPGRDHLFGGRGEDDLDVIRGAVGAPKVPAGSQRYPTIADYEAAFGGSYDADPGAQGDDIAYGGHNRDLLQADAQGDRLVDSMGAFNLYFVCPAAYGGEQITRALSPGILNFFQDLAEANGAIGAAKPISYTATTGALEASIVYPYDANQDNVGSAYPTTPGHFTCT